MKSFWLALLMFPPLILYQSNPLPAFSSNLLRFNGVSLGHLSCPLWIFSWSSKTIRTSSPPVLPDLLKAAPVLDHSSISLSLLVISFWEWKWLQFKNPKHKSLNLSVRPRQNCTKSKTGFRLSAWVVLCFSAVSFVTFRTDSSPKFTHGSLYYRKIEWFPAAPSKITNTCHVFCYL